MPLSPDDERALRRRAASEALAYALFLLRLGREGLSAHYYTRSVELPLAAAWLAPRAGQTLVDVGCGEGPAPLFLARRGARVLATDLSPEVARGRRWTERWRRGARWLGGRAPGRVTPLVADARRLPLADGSVDRALALSSLEHVPGDGDGQATGELGRVLRRGGRAFVSVEVAHVHEEVRAAHSHTVGHDYADAGAQLVRYYDLAALERRLVAPSGLRCAGALLFGERDGPLRARFDRPAFRARWYWAALPVARARMRRVAPGELARLPRTEANRSNAVACLLLRKD